MITSGPILLRPGAVRLTATGIRIDYLREGGGGFVTVEVLDDDERQRLLAAVRQYIEVVDVPATSAEIGAMLNRIG